MQNSRIRSSANSRGNVLRSRAAQLLSTTVLVATFAGYGRNAYAACAPVGGTYQCSGAETITQVVSANNAAVTTLPDFSVDTTLSGGNALTITGNGAISYTDANARPLTAAATALEIRSIDDDVATTGSVDVETNGTLIGGTYGIDARNGGSGALTIDVTGEVSGNTAVGIRARNYTGLTPIPDYPYFVPYAKGTDITITTGVGTTVAGGRNGIEATNWGSGAVTIIADGDVTGALGGYGYGIRTTNFGDGDTTIATGVGTTVSGHFGGINARSEGAGNLTITTNGDVAGVFGGIRARQTTETGELNVTVNGDVNTTYGPAVYADRTSAGYVPGVAGITIITNGNLVSTYGNGIQARNVDGGDIAIGVYGNVTSGSTGIRATTVRGGHLDITTDVGTTVSGFTGMDARADGNLTITTDGDVLGINTGIEARAYDQYGVTGNELVIVANGAVTGRFGAIEATNFGTGLLSITVAGSVNSSEQDGIYAERQYSDGGNIEIVVESTGIVQGAQSGVEIVSNSGLSTVENAGTIRNASGATTAIAITSATAGDVEITNTGTVIGTVNLGGGNDVFNEQSLSSWHTAGGTNDFGAGANNEINNDGRIVSAEVGALGAVTTIFQATGGTLAFNSNAGGVLDMSNGVVGDVSQVGNAALFNGTFIANGGIVQIDTELGDDSSLTDLLVINGNTVLGTGATRLQVANVGGTGGQTVQGIKVVDVTSTSAAGAFDLLGDFAVNGQQAVAAGAFSYSLFQGTPTENDGDWYLRSIGFSPSAAVFESYAVVLLGLIDMPTLQQRVGNIYMPNTGSRTDGFVNPEPAADIVPQAPPPANFWTRIDAAYGHYEGDSDTGTEYDLNRYRVQVGIDGRFGESADGIFIGGINLQYGHADADLESDTGDGDNKTDSYGGGLTLTWIGASGFYADAQGSVHYLETDLSSDALGDLVDNNEGWGYGLSLELGRKVALDDTISLTPQAQLAYTSVDFDDFTDELGVDVSLNEGESLKGRLGVALGFDSYDSGDTRGHVYAIANVTYEFLDAQSVDVAGVELEFEPEEFGGELGLGGTYEWAQGQYAIHGEALGQTSFEGSYGVKGTAGFSVKF